MKQLRMGIIGIGMAFERLHYPEYQKLTDQYSIRAICDINKEKAENWRSTLGLRQEDVYSDYREMMRRDDLDAFDIMVPIELNYQITKAVAEAGKPIICEKPLAATKQEALAARDLPRKFDVPIMIAENYRYNDEINTIRQLVQQNDIGSVHYFIQNRVVDFPQDMLQDKFPAKEWRQHPNFPGGAFYDTGVHDIGALQHIFGPIHQVHAFGRKQEQNFSPYSVIQANLTFENQITGQFTFFCAGKEMQRPLIGLRIFGAKGMLYLEERDCGVVNVCYNDGTSRQIPYQQQMGFYHELLNFYKAAIGAESVSVTPELEFGDAYVCLTILESIEKQKVLSLQREEALTPAYS